jgi:hypothetical protein
MAIPSIFFQVAIELGLVLPQLLPALGYLLAALTNLSAIPGDLRRRRATLDIAPEFHSVAL